MKLYAIYVSRTALAIVLSAALAACGGGSSGTAPGVTAASVIPAVTVADIAVQPTVKTPLPAEVETAKTVVIAAAITASPTLQVTMNTSQTYVVGDTVMLPADPRSIPLGFTGKVVSTTTVGGKQVLSLVEADFGDVFKSLKLDLNTSRDQARVVGVIAPPGVKAQFTATAPQALQTGVTQDLQSCGGQVGLSFSGKLECKQSYVEGTLGVEHSFEMTQKDGSKKTTGKMFVTVDIKKGVFKSKVDINPGIYDTLVGNQWGTMEQKFSGEISASVGFEIPGEKGDELYRIPSLRELIAGSDGLSKWDNAQWDLGKYARLKGLESDDKRGLLPIAGLVIDPACVATSVATAGAGFTTACTFKGDIADARFSAAKPAAVIVWIYLNASGELSFSGKVNLLKMDDYKFEAGQLTTFVGAEANVSETFTQNAPVIKILEVNGKLQGKLNLGVSMAVDLMVAGIRPAALQIVPIEVVNTTTAEGSFGLQVFPEIQNYGAGCVSNSGVVQSKVRADVAVKGALGKKDSVKLDLGYNKEWPKVWRQIEPSNNCFTSDNLNFALSFVGPATTPASNLLYKLDFATSFNSAGLRALVSKWTVQLGDDAPIELKDVTDGTAQFAIAAGRKVNVTLRAINELDVTGGSKIATVVKSSTQELQALAMPMADFTAEIVDGNCQQLRLRSNNSLGGGTSVASYLWTVVPSGGATITARTAVADIALPACGAVQVTHAIANNLNMIASVVRSVDTSNLAPVITSVLPLTARVDQSVTFAVLGRNLPQTAIAALADAECAVPTQRTDSGFNQVCTPRAAGSKGVTIKAQPNGLVLSTAFTVNVQNISSNSAPTDWLRAAHFLESCTVAEQSQSGAVASTSRVGQFCGTAFNGSRSIQMSGSGSVFDTALGSAPRFMNGLCSATITARVQYQKAGVGQSSWAQIVASGDSRNGFDPVSMQFSDGGLANNVTFTDNLQSTYPGGRYIQLGNLSGTLISNTPTISTTNYSHVAMVTEGVPGSQVSKLYIDGVLKSQNSVSASVCIGYDADMQMTIGTLQGQQNWVGKISFVRAFGRALTQNEIIADSQNIPVAVTQQAAITQTFVVSALNYSGTSFVVPVSSLTCSFNANGTWKSSPTSTNIGPDGLSGGVASSASKIPGSAPGILVVKRGGIFYPAGAFSTFAVVGGETIMFSVDDGANAGSYGDNSGSLDVMSICR